MRQILCPCLSYYVFVKIGFSVLVSIWAGGVIKALKSKCQSSAFPLRSLKLEKDFINSDGIVQMNLNIFYQMVVFRKWSKFKSVCAYIVPFTHAHAAQTLERALFYGEKVLLSQLIPLRQKQPCPVLQALSKTRIAIFHVCIFVAVTRKPMLTFILTMAGQYRRE